MDQPPRIGRYSLVRRVGAGGFATVWLARDEQLDADVAVKILSDNWIEDGEVRRRFLAEGRFLRKVDSLYVVGVHDIGEADDGRPFMVLTYADGGTLADRIKAGPLEFAEAVRIITQVGRGLKHLHARGVLHRDVKPANVLFHTDPAGDRAMLSDLGLGKALAEVSRITLPGGTPAYVAPEQVRGERLDQRADLYSLGAVAYAAFTGQAPHGVATLGAVMQIEKPPPSMTTLREDVPDAIDVVVRRALEPDRDKRWPDLDSFLNALREAHTTGKVPAGLVPAEEMPTPVPATGDVDQATALSGASQQTTANQQADPTQPTGLTPAGSGQATDSTQPVGAGRPPAARPKRSARSGVIAVLVALLLAAGGGYGGYKYVLSRPVKVEDKPLSVEVPRAWSQKAVDPGKSLVVSTNTSTWLSNPDTEGVFVGLVASSRLPTSATPPEGCTTVGPERDEIDDQQVATFQWPCSEGPSVLEQYRQVNDTTQVRVQVRDDNATTRQAVLDSVMYTP
ncbi:MAG TPA: serine/threonine-protein kinase [Kribbella sp.]|nr:serine/threonine-protein kinase [Kribbella sp.]